MSVKTKEQKLRSEAISLKKELSNLKEAYSELEKRNCILSETKENLTKENRVLYECNKELRQKYEPCHLREPKYTITIKENPHALGGIEIATNKISLHDTETALEIAKTLTQKQIRNI